MSIDFFTVPTIRFQVLDVFPVLAHDRRRIVHFNLTAHPTAEWSAQQLREAFPFDQAPQYLLRDRDRIFGAEFSQQVADLGTEEVLGAPRSPWQRACVERAIGTIRRDVIVFNEVSLYRHLTSFLAYYHESWTHLSLYKNTPEARPVQPPELGTVIAIPQVGGFHHRYERPRGLNPREWRHSHNPLIGGFVGRAACPPRPRRSQRRRLTTTFLRRCWAVRISSGPRKWDVLDQTTGQSCGRAVVDEVSENHSPLSGGAVSLVRGYPLPDVERRMPRATVTFGRISLCT
jgi:hypothetical protein